MENLTFLLTWEYEWERIENISAEKAQKHSLILRGMKIWLEGYLYLYQPFLRETIVREITFRLSAFLFLSRIFLPYTSFIPQGGKKKKEKKKGKKKKSAF